MEQWRDIPGHEGAYQVSDLGRVRSMDRLITTKTGTVKKCRGRVLKPRVRRDGYQHVCLYYAHKSYACFLVHRLVLLAFVGPPEPGQLHTRHLDGNKHNNRLANLCWGTAKENYGDMVAHGTARRRFTESEVRRIRAICAFGGVGAKSALAEELGVSTPLISYISSGRIYAHV